MEQIKLSLSSDLLVSKLEHRKKECCSARLSYKEERWAQENSSNASIKYLPRRAAWYALIHMKLSAVNLQALVMAHLQNSYCIQYAVNSKGAKVINTHSAYKIKH